MESLISAEPGDSKADSRTGARLGTREFQRSSLHDVSLTGCRAIRDLRQSLFESYYVARPSVPVKSRAAFYRN
jgi:hypothetical protein